MPDLTTREDLELLQLIRSRDTTALQEVFRRYWEKLVAIGYYHTKDKHAAEDIVSDVLSGLWFKAPTLEIHSLSAYLATAVKYSVFKATLRQQRRDEILQERGPVHEGGKELEERLEARFLQEYLDNAIEELPQTTRLIFQFSREEQLSNAEIAGKMQLSNKSVEYHITKALKHLREKIRRFNFFSW